LSRGRRKNQKNSQAVSPLNFFGKREKERMEKKKIEEHKFLSLELFLTKKMFEQKLLEKDVETEKNYSEKSL